MFDPVYTYELTNLHTSPSANVCKKGVLTRGREAAPGAGESRSLKESKRNEGAKMINASVVIVRKRSQIGKINFSSLSICNSP